MSRKKFSPFIIPKGYTISEINYLQKLQKGLIVFEKKIKKRKR